MLFWLSIIKYILFISFFFYLTENKEYIIIINNEIVENRAVHYVVEEYCLHKTF